MLSTNTMKHTACRGCVISQQNPARGIRMNSSQPVSRTYPSSAAPAQDLTTSASWRFAAGEPVHLYFLCSFPSFLTQRGFEHDAHRRVPDPDPQAAIPEK